MPSSSRLALFSEKLIQAGWLIALIIAPLFFNIYSSRVFEPDKITLIRTLALSMGAVWLVLRAERWRAVGGTRRTELTLSARLRGWVRHASNENPLTLPALFLLLAYILSTLLSVSPTVSFFGSYQRLQGLYTFSAYLVIFFLGASQIKTRSDVERAITIALVVSFPIALYGIIQHYFVDPLPWVGDVTTRVASNLGNSIFIGAVLILAIPLAVARLIQSSERAAASLAPATRIALFIAAVATLLLVAAAWGLSFDLTAKPAIEANYNGILTPEQLALAAGAFNIALVITFLAVAAWCAAAFLVKQPLANFLLIALYTALLAVQLVTLVFSQSRGPLLGLLGGMFTFGVLFALVRGRRKLAVGAVSAAGLLVVVLLLVNIPNTPLTFVRDLPYVGRLGRVFELEGGTGRVRVLIWQGALKLILPHEPLSSPLTGNDAFNLIRPLVGYGPETMYVSYNKFYPPELGTLESRNATPDRSHNETFDALVTTGLIGFFAENILFLTVFYFALKWLGLMPSPRSRNIFIALWYGTGILLALVFGIVFGWEFIGVALPGGMILGMFIYLVAVAVRGGTTPALQSPTSTLWLVALVSLFVSHFIEIHFGIAIVSTRLSFWFFAAVFVALGARHIPMGDETESVPAPAAAEKSEPQTSQAKVEPSTRRKRASLQSSRPSTASEPTRARSNAPARRISTAPLITYAFLVGFMLAVMGYDYINTNNLSFSNSAISGLQIVISALTFKNTTAGTMPSFSMLWLLVTTLLLGIGICAGEWGRDLRISRRDWGVAVLLFFVLAFAIFSGLVFYHVLLIAATGTALLNALLASVGLFTVFMLIVAAVCAGTLMFDEPMPAALVSRTTNWVVTPVLLIIAAVLIFATNVDPIRADMLYKQAASFTGQNNAASIQLFQNALELQPQQDYYYLFLGRAYLDSAKSETDGTARADTLKKAEDALNDARVINPYNTDHSANLARLAQARGSLSSDVPAQIEAYKQASTYFAQATTLSPNTAHLYDQYAQALLEYAQVLQQSGDAAGATTIHTQAQSEIQDALNVDATFCLTYAVRAQAQTDWHERVTDALKAIALAPRCGDVFFSEGLSLAVNQLAVASDEALQAKQGPVFEQLVAQAAQTTPTLEIYTTLANFYSKAGRIPDAIHSVDQALSLIPESDTATRKRYEDFRFTLVNLQDALDAASASPNDVELQRAVAQQWLVRGQFDLALAGFQKVAQLKPDDYNAQRNIVFLLITTDQLPQATTLATTTGQLAPQTEQVFWQRLNAVLNDINKNDTPSAATQLEELAKGADTNDYALVSALRKLAEKLKGAG